MPAYAHTLLPIGTEVSVFDREDDPDSMPIYEGDAESAHMSLLPGLYPFAHENDEYLLIVTPAGESFAVSTNAEALDAVWPIVPA